MPGEEINDAAETDTNANGYVERKITMAPPTCISRPPNSLTVYKGDSPTTLINVGDTVTLYVRFPKNPNGGFGVYHTLDGSIISAPTWPNWNKLDSQGCGQVDVTFNVTNVYELKAYVCNPTWHAECYNTIGVQSNVYELTVGTAPPPPPVAPSYDCVNGQCIETTSYVGPYSTIDACIAAGCKAPTPPTPTTSTSPLLLLAVIGGLAYILMSKR